MDILVFIIISTILYRMPRGTGFRGSSFWGSFIWASVSSLILSSIFLNPVYILFTIPLMIGESFGWSQYWPNNEDGGDIKKLSLRGCLLLNPLMGPIYFITYKYMGPDKPWTIVSEYLSGFVTASVLVGILSYV